MLKTYRILAAVCGVVMCLAFFTFAACVFFAIQLGIAGDAEAQRFGARLAMGSFYIGGMSMMFWFAFDTLRHRMQVQHDAAVTRCRDAMSDTPMREPVQIPGAVDTSHIDVPPVW